MDKLYDYMDWPRIEAIVYGEEASPKDVMAPRITPDGILVQGFFPEAEEVKLLSGRKSYDMERQDEAGYFAALIPGRKLPKYRFSVKWEGGARTEYEDPYACPGQITEEEEKSFLAGTYYEAYRKLGSHVMTVNGAEGVYFAVWAPNAMRVSVVGDFNQWDGRRLPMHRMPMSGIFDLFVPGIRAGAEYKYEIKIKGGGILMKADPYAWASALPERDNSVVADVSGYVWSDQAWMKQREEWGKCAAPMSIYETSLQKWESGEQLADFVKELGYTHVEFHPVMEYLEDDTEYSTFAYFAPTGRYGKPVDFQKTVDALHRADIGVILDWTPAQFPRHESGLEKYDGTALYEPADPAYALHPVWGTMLYNYASPMVVDFLISNACYWTEVYHADGLRMDDVDAMLYLDYGRSYGQWQPNLYGSNENLHAMEFLKHLNSIMKKRNPGVLLIAQEDGLWPELTGSVEEDHLGFDYKWSGGWTGDFLSYLETDPIERKHLHDQLTLSMVYAYCERYILTLGSRDVGTLSSFMERLPGSRKQKEAQIRCAYSYQMLHPGCKMTAPDRDMPKGLQACIQDLHKLYRNHPAMYSRDDTYDGFQWIQLMKYEENVLAFLRVGEKPEDTLLAVCNFAAIPYEKYQVGVPFCGKYKEIFNSDSLSYGGEGVTNPRVKTAVAQTCDEREYSIKLKLPALGVSVLTCTPTEASSGNVSAPKAPKKKTAVKKSASKKTVK